MKGLKLAVVITAAVSLFACAKEESNSRTICAGRPSSNYNMIAEAIAQVGQTVYPQDAFTVAESAGSEENIRNVTSGRYQFGITQADVLYDAVNAEGMFAGESKLTNLRAIAGLYPEAIQIVTRKDREMYTVPGLWGATVGVGDSHSGTEQNAFFILRAADLNESLVTTVNMSTQEACEALKNGTIDAFFYTSGAPSALIENLADEIDICLIPVSGKLQSDLLKEHAYYEECVIPAGTYRNQEEDVTTISIESVLITSDQESSDSIRKFTDALFASRETIEQSVKLDFSFDETTAVNHIPVPFHDGAKAYYESKGIQVKES